MMKYPCFFCINRDEIAKLFFVIAEMTMQDYALTGMINYMKSDNSRKNNHMGITCVS